MALVDNIELKNCTNIGVFLNKIPTKTNIICMHINIRSIIKNFSSLEHYIHSCTKQIDVIIITEANISDTLSNLFNLDGYNMYTNLRKNRKGGGIIIYIKKGNKIIARNTKTIHFEGITAIITTVTNYSFNLLAIYRPPSTSKYLFIHELQQTCLKFNKHEDFYIIGNTNIDLATDTPIKHKYTTMLCSYGLENVISEYTRIESRNGKICKSCIDHIIVRSHSQDVYAAALGTVLADHRAIALACVGTQSSAMQIQGAPKFKTCIDRSKVNSLLQKVDWKATNNMDCPLSIFSYIKTNFEQCYNDSKICIRLSKRSATRMDKTWVNKVTVNACVTRDNWFRQWLKNPNDMVIKQKYNRARNFANKLISSIQLKKLKINALKMKLIKIKTIPRSYGKFSTKLQEE